MKRTSLPLRRREFITLLGGTLVAWPLAARAQQPSMPVVGFISSRSPDESASAVVAFRQGLAEAGCVERQNVEIAFRWAEGHYDRLPMMAADLARRQVTAILATGGNPPVFAVKAATATIPIVFIIGSDPVEVGFVASLNRPGANITGVSLFTSVLVAKRLELLRELVPAATIIAFLVNPDNSNAQPDTAVMQAAAARLGQKLIVLSARTDQDIDLAFASLGQQQATALVVNTDAFFLTRRNQLASLEARYAIPGAPKKMSLWIEVGGSMIAIDTLVHNFLHRTGILHRFDATHTYGLACYRPGGCADIIQAIAEHIDARQFNPSFPKTFPRFVQQAIWRYCSLSGLDVCNGNRIDDSRRCENKDCRVRLMCDRVALR